MQVHLPVINLYQLLICLLNILLQFNVHFFWTSNDCRIEHVSFHTNEDSMAIYVLFLNKRRIYHNFISEGEADINGTYLLICGKDTSVEHKFDESLVHSLFKVDLDSSVYAPLLLLLLLLH